MNVEIHIELYVEGDEQFVFIQHSCSSGAKYKIKNISELGKIIQYYADTYL